MSESDLNQRVELEKFQKLVKSLHMAIVAQIAVMFLIGSYLVDKMNSHTFIVWSAVFTTLCIACLIIGVVYRLDEKQGRAEARFHQYMTISMVCSFALGAFWTATAFSRFNEPIAQQAIVLLILVGQSAGSVMALAPNMKLFYAGVPVSLLPLGFGYLWLGDRTHTMLGALLILFFLFFTFLAHMVNRLVTESIRLRFRNDDLQKDKSRFLATASHDLRQPLHALTLYISALEQRQVCSESSDIIGNIKSTLNSLQRLFDGLLDLSKFDAGVLQPQIKDVLWSDIKRKLQEELSTLATQKNINIKWSAQDFCLRSDELLLEQIMRNLVGNAIRYTDKGSISIRCIRDEIDGDNGQYSRMRIDVIDTGVGINQQYQNTIYDAYYRVPDSGDATINTGLGLSIVKRLTSQLGHQLVLLSEEGVGSCFSVILKGCDSHKIHVAKQQARALEASLQRECTKILVIDNDPCVRDATSKLLESWGCDVYTSASVQDTLEHIDTSKVKPSGIITDYKHIGLITQIEKHFGSSKIPVVVLSGAADLSKLETPMNQYQVMRKPLKPACLRAFVINTRENNLGTNESSFSRSPSMQDS